MTIEELNALYEATDFGNNAKYSGSVVPMAVSNPAGLQTIDIAQVPMGQPVTQSNGLPYLLNQSGNQNQNFSMEEYEKAFANQNTEPTDNFLTRALSGVGDKFSGIMNNKFVQNARNIGSIIGDPLMGGITYLMSKADKFNSLPYVDQQYVKQNMGYTGPTIFGENTSGLSKDPYGLNVRSAGLFSDTDGSYGQVQVNEAKKLGENITKRAKEKYGVDFNVNEFLEKGDEYLKTLSGKEVDKFKSFNKLNLERLNFYGKGSAAFLNQKANYQKAIEIKEIEREKRRIEAREAAEREAAAMAEVRAQQAKDEAVYRTQPGQYGGDNRQQEREQAGPGYSGSGTAAEMGSFKKGGRTGYGTGGIVSL